MFIRSVSKSGPAGRATIRGLLLVSTLSIGCGTDNDSPPLGSGGSSAGGLSSFGGISASAGSGGVASGGMAAGGSPSGMGGSSSVPATGGASGSGGLAAGGSAANGGQSAGGASAGSGGNGGASAGSGGASAGSGGGGGSGGGSAGAKSTGCGATRKLTNGRKTISSDGANREYILRAPDNYDNSKPYRLVMAYHWRSGNAKQVAEGGNGGSTEDPFYGLWDLAQNSTIFVAPEGLDAG